MNGSAVEDETAETAEDTESETEVQQQKAPVNMGSIYLVFGAIALIGIGAAGFILTKKNGKSKSLLSLNRLVQIQRKMRTTTSMTETARTMSKQLQTQWE